MNSKVWGKHVWKAIHYISNGYPDDPSKEQKRDYKKFFILLKTILPCSTCREHYIENLKIHPLTNKDLINKNTLVKWTIELHNIINDQLGNSIMYYDDALNDIKSYEVCHTNNKWAIKKRKN